MGNCMQKKDSKEDHHDFELSVEPKKGEVYLTLKSKTLSQPMDDDKDKVSDEKI
jgi:hypothetical protein